MSSQAITPNREAAILARLILSQDRSIEPEASFAFQPSDMKRMHELAERAQTAELTLAEHDELNSYLHVSNLVAIIQSKRGGS